MTTYEIRKEGRVWVSSPLPDCGYPPQTLRSLREHGFRLHTVAGRTPVGAGVPDGPKTGKEKK